jgi:hypothetical protein
MFLKIKGCHKSARKHMHIHTLVCACMCMYRCVCASIWKLTKEPKETNVKISPLFSSECHCFKEWGRYYSGKWWFNTQVVSIKELAMKIWASLYIGRAAQLFSYSFESFDGTGIWTLGFVLAKQALYCLSHDSTPFELF